MNKKQMLFPLLFPLLITILVFHIPSFPGESFQNAREAFRKGDYKTAVREYRKAAEEGDALAQFSLGQFYEQGSIVPKNDTEAVKYYTMAAKNEHPDACYKLAKCYAEGLLGLQKNDTESAKWYERAAENGSFLSLIPLGNIYEKGKGVPKDLIKAYMWYSLALGEGQVTVKEPLDRITNQITPSQIEQAKELSAKWLEKYRGDSPLKDFEGWF